MYLKSAKFIGLFVILSLVLSFGHLMNARAQNRREILRNQKLIIQKQIDQIQSDLIQIGENFNENRSQRITLNEQIQAIQTEIKEIDDLIIQTRTMMGEINLEISKKQARIQELNQQILQILIEIQKFQHVSFVQTLFTSENFGELISKMYSLSTLEVETKELKNQIQAETQELERSLKQQQETEAILNQTRAAAKARSSDLIGLLAQTEGRDDRYQALLDSLNQQKEELKADINILDGNFLSHIADELEGQKHDHDHQEGECKFEATEVLDVDTDYFTRPTKGFLTQGFHCGHDGVDIANSSGTELYSIADGVVERIGPNNDKCVGIRCNGGFGNYVLIKHILPSGQTLYSLFAHMQNQTFLSLGQSVDRGQVVGYMGCTGYTKPYPCGVHTHFVMYSDSYETSGLGCRLGRSKCFNPLKYIFPIA